MGAERSWRLEHPSQLVDPGFVAGRVVDVAGRGDLTVLDSDEQLRPIRTDERTRVWSEGRWSTDGLGAGRCIYARGAVDPEGVLAVDKAWIGIENVTAALVAARPGTATIRFDNGVDVEVRVTGETDVVVPGVAVAKGDVSAIRRGTVVRIIGFGDFDSGFTATRIFSMTGHATASTPERRSLASAGRVSSSTIDGLASWMCCGGVNSCGSGQCTKYPQCCPPPGSGACTTCRTDLSGFAYPNVVKYDGLVCDFHCNSGCCPSMPRLHCGDVAGIRNLCTGIVGAYSIVECGPSVRCISPHGCNGFVTVKFDLTACAFTGLGGSLDAGFINARVTFLISTVPERSGHG